LSFTPDAAGFGTPHAYLYGMRILGRIFLVLLMIPVTLYLIGAGYAMVAVSHSHPEMTAFNAGRAFGAFMILALLIWFFKGLGNRSTDF
jgi:hypothetical protein